MFDASASADLPGGSITSNLGGDLIANRATLDGAIAYVVSDVEVQAISAMDGRVLWTAPFEGADADDRYQPFVSERGPRPPVVSDDGATVYAATSISVEGAGSTPGHDAVSVMAMEADTGSVMWATEVPVPRELAGHTADGSTQVTGLHDGHVAVNWVYDGHTRDGYLAVIEEATLDVAWAVEDFASTALVGDALVGLVNSGGYGLQQVQALDIATGEVLHEHEVYEATLWPAGSNQVAVRWRDVDDRSALFGFFDPATGDLTSVAEGQMSTGCFDDDTTATLLCSSRDSAAAYDLETHELLWYLPDDNSSRVAPRRVLSLWRGVAYAKDSEGNPYAIDARTGEDLAVEIGVAPFQVSTTHGIWFDSDGPKVAPAVG